MCGWCGNKIWPQRRKASILIASRVRPANISSVESGIAVILSTLKDDAKQVLTGRLFPPFNKLVKRPIEIPAHIEPKRPMIAAIWRKYYDRHEADCVVLPLQFPRILPRRSCFRIFARSPENQKPKFKNAWGLSPSFRFRSVWLGARGAAAGNIPKIGWRAVRARSQPP